MMYAGVNEDGAIELLHFDNMVEDPEEWICNWIADHPEEDHMFIMLDLAPPAEL